MENEKINVLKEYFEKENENIERGKNMIIICQILKVKILLRKMKIKKMN